MIDYSLRDIASVNIHHPILDEWRRLQRDLIMLYDDRVPLGGSRRGFSEPFYTLWMIRFGTVDIQSDNGDSVRADTDNWVLIPPFYRHSQSFSANARIFSIHFSCQWPNSTMPFQIDHPLVVEKTDWPGIEDTLLELLKVVVSRDEAVPLVQFSRMEGRLLDFLAAWYDNLIAMGFIPRGPMGLDQRVQGAVEYLQSIEYTGTIPYKRLEQEIAVSRTHLDRLFKQELGKTPKQFLDSRIVDQVIGELLSSRKTVSDICFDNGFVSPSHFSRWFKGQTGRTPREYREHLGSIRKQ